MSGQTEEKLDFDYDSIPVGYYDDVFHRRHGIQSKWHHVRFSRVRDMLEEAGGGKVLDLGCGPGTFADVLSSFDYTGIDIAAEQIEFARRKYSNATHRFVQGSAFELPFPNDHFDLACSVEVIEHLTLESGQKMLSEALRVLKPGGTMVFTTPNYRSIWPILEHIVNRVSPVDYGDQHITKFNRPRLQRLMTDIGFSNVNVRSYVHISPFFAAINWKLADVISNIEYPLLRFGGCHLLARGQKAYAS